jgi:hypothetical protein
MAGSRIYTTPSICEREGHVQSRDISYVPATPFCGICGSKAMMTCGSCGVAIHGTMGRHPGAWEPPNYCHDCGSMYPWTARRIEAAKDLIIESDPSAQDVASAIPDLAQPSANSTASIHKVGAWLKGVAPVLARSVWDLIAPILTSEAKARLGLPP